MIIKSQLWNNGFFLLFYSFQVFYSDVLNHTPINIHMLCYAKSLQSCPTLCDPIDGSPPGSPVPGILQARTLEWVAISFDSYPYNWVKYFCKINDPFAKHNLLNVFCLCLKEVYKKPSPVETAVKILQYMSYGDIFNSK